VNHIDGLRTQKVLEGPVPDRTHVVPSDLLQRRRVWINDGGEFGVAKPADGARVLSSHLPSAKDCNAQRFTLRVHMRVTHASSALDQDCNRKCK
jgi:hypothetical protein